MPSARPALPLLLVGAFCLLTACGGVAASGAPAARVGPRVGDVAPAVAGTSIEGRPFSAGVRPGSVLVVMFWASWCVPCQAEQPAVDALARQESQAGVRFAGVSVDVDRWAAQSFASRFAIPYDSVIDVDQALVVAFEVTGPPTTFVVDGSGRVDAELIGEVNIDDLRARIAAAAATR